MRKIPEIQTPVSSPQGVPITIPREHKDETLGGGRRAAGGGRLEGEGAA